MSPNFTTTASENYYYLIVSDAIVLEQYNNNNNNNNQTIYRVAVVVIAAAATAVAAVIIASTFPNYRFFKKIFISLLSVVLRKTHVNIILCLITTLEFLDFYNNLIFGTLVCYYYYVRRYGIRSPFLMLIVRTSSRILYGNDEHAKKLSSTATECFAVLIPHQDIVTYVSLLVAK